MLDSVERFAAALLLDTGWLDEPDGRRWCTIWDAETFAGAVATAGFVVDRVDEDGFVEVWATRLG